MPSSWTAAPVPGVATLLAARVERQHRPRRRRTARLSRRRRADIRAGNWRIAPVPLDLQDRRVEITGPVDRKMVINAAQLGSQDVHGRPGRLARPHLATDARTDRSICAMPCASTIELSQSRALTRLNRQRATLLVRPRGWHLDERHVLVDGRPISASAFSTSGSTSLFTTRRSAASAGNGSLLLPAKAGEPPGSAVVERCVHPGPEPAEHSAALDQVYGVDRDDSGGASRWTKSPLRAARPVYPV